MYPWKTIKYYTLREILNLIPDEAPEFPHSDFNYSRAWFINQLLEIEATYKVVGVDPYWTSTILNGILQDLMNTIFNRHYNDYFYSKNDQEDTNLELEGGDYKLAISRVLTLFEITAPRYLTILKSFTDKSLNPIGKVSSETTGRVRFNDTPQDEGDYDEEDHATTSTHNVSKTEFDSGSIMDRLNSLKDYRSVILDWSNEFDRLFFKEEQL